MRSHYEQPLFEHPSAFIPGSDGRPSDVVDFSQLQPLVDQGAIHARQHPEFPLTVYTYSGIHAQRATAEGGTPYERIIDVCRGLVVHSQTGLVIARPFERMTELAQAIEPGVKELPEGPKTVYPKIDGTLGIQYQGNDGEQYIATRGSFDASHARIGSTMLQQYVRDNTFEAGVTHLWEVVVPDGDYTIRHTPGMTLIGRIATASGIELPLPNQSDVSYPVVQTLEGPAYETALSMRGLDDGTTEGFVVRMDDTGQRFKVKHPSYRWLSMERDQEIPIYLRDQVFKEGKQLRHIVKKAPHSVRELVKRHADALDAEIAVGLQPILDRMGGADIALTPQQEAILNQLMHLGRRAVLGTVIKKVPRRQARSQRDAQRRAQADEQ